MTSKHTRKVSFATRREILRRSLGLAAAAGTVPLSKAAMAEDQWWESIIGRGTNFNNTRPQRPQRKTYEMGDMRKGPTPWLSDVTLAATRDSIERYRRIVSAGGWPQVPGPRSIRPGDYDDRVPALRKRLRATGELPPSGYFDNYEFDDGLVQAVGAFQARHGLRITKRVDRATFAALNVSADMRLQQLELNYRRIQALMNEAAVNDRYVLVNAAAYQLEAVENYEVQQRHRIIAGRPERQTPEIRATILGLNFFPYWRVPLSVAKYDLVPRMQKDPGYLEREHIRALRGSFNGEEVPLSSIDWNNVDFEQIHFRQDPGEWNALGLVRIDMPNSETVYMHDTPMKQLFDQAARAYSAGCVRVQGVFDLVDWIAKYEPGWEMPGNSERIVASGQALDMKLTRPVPVIFTYITAWGESNGGTEFRRDIYDRDGSRALAGEFDDDEAGPPVAVNALSP